MGRRNGNTNKRARYPQARKRSPEEAIMGRKPRMAGKPPPIPVNKMVLPVGKCGRKLKFGSKQDAERALRQANQNRRRNGQSYHEVRVYEHDICGGWHLTSREFDAEKARGA